MLRAALVLGLLVALAPAAARATTAPAPVDPIPAFLVGSGTMLIAPSIGGLPAGLLAVAIGTLAPTLAQSLLLNPLVWFAGAILVAAPVAVLTAFTICATLEGDGYRPDFFRTWLAGALVATVGILGGVALLAGGGFIPGLMMLSGTQYVFLPFVQTFVAARYPLGATGVAAAAPGARPEIAGNF